MFGIYRGQRTESFGSATGSAAAVAVALTPVQTTMLEIESAHLSDNGRVRPHNEDFVGHVLPATPEQARSHGYLFALADGVGGAQQGEVASRAAVESLLQGFRDANKGEPLSGLLQRLVQEANAHVFQVAVAAGTAGAGMATTLVACALRHDRAVVAHVGDSRCYLIRRGEAIRLTRDHTVASEHERLGLLTAQEAAEADSRHVLSRSLGGGLFVGVDIDDHQVFPGDVLLLCCDGLHGSVKPSEMVQLVGNGQDLHSAARNLVALANEKDGGDNVSVQLIRVLGVERVGMYRGRPYKLR
jgi:serine/threonine protein phosphatase PrpC